MLTRLKQRLAVQTKSMVHWKGGSYTTSWNTSTTIWAKVNFYKVDETYANIKEQQFNYAKIIVRKGINLDKATCRFVLSGNVFHIEDIADLTNNGRFLEIKTRCEVGVNG